MSQADYDRGFDWAAGALLRGTPEEELEKHWSISGSDFDRGVTDALIAMAFARGGRAGEVASCS